MPHHRRVPDVCLYDSSSSDEFYTTIPHRRHVRHGSVVSTHHHHHVLEPVYAPSPSLAVPVVDVGGRKRASSTNGLPQPNIIINADGGSRSRSRERTRRRSPSRGRRLDDDEYEETIERRGRISRTPSPYYRPQRVERVEQVERVDYETRKALEKLKIFEEEKAAEEAQKKYIADMELKRAKEQLDKAEAEEKRRALEKKYIADMELKRAREQLEKAEAEEKQKALKKKAVEEWQREQDAKKAKEKKEKEELDKKVDEQFRAKLAQAGYSPSEIEDIINHKAERDEKKHVNEMRIAHLRPTYIKVHKKYLLPETLDVYRLPWSYDSKDSDYILIEKYVDDDLQEELFAHTRKIRSRKLIEPASIEKKVIVKINDKKKDKMYLVRKKDTSPLRFGVFG